jgi:hypothetical protein
MESNEKLNILKNEKTNLEESINQIKLENENYNE